VTTEKGEAWYTRYWAFVRCSEEQYDKTPETALAMCASAAGFDAKETANVQRCYTTPSGDASVIREAKATFDHPGTPTLLVANETSSPDSALKDVCAAYAGPKPAGCKLMKDSTAGLSMMKSHATLC